MRLYIKQSVFSWNDRFFVTDEFGNDRYYVEGELFSFGKKLHVYNMYDEEVAYIQQKLISFMPRFYVYKGECEVAQIVKKLTFLYPSYEVEGLGWKVDGDLWAHDYCIVENDFDIVNIHKAWMSWGDSFELDIADDVDEVIALAVVLAIDAVIDSDNN